MNDRDCLFMGNGKIKLVDKRTHEEWAELRRKTYEKRDLISALELCSSLSKKDILEAEYRKMLRGETDSVSCLSHYEALQKAFLCLIPKVDTDMRNDIADSYKTVQDIIGKVALHMTQSTVQSGAVTRASVESVPAPEKPTQEAPPYVPAYIKHLIDKGHLYDDGKRVIKSLDKTAMAYVEFVESEVTMRFLQETFRKTNGEPFSDRACDNAAKLANTKPAKAKPEKK